MVTLRHCSVVCSISGALPPTPALAMQVSIRPIRERLSAIASTTAASSDTLTDSASIRVP